MSAPSALMSAEALEAAGYRRFTDHTKTDSMGMYKGSWQKHVSDHQGIQYFITVDHYVFAVGNAPTASFQANVQFNTSSDTKPCFNVDLLHPESVLAMEAFFERLWHAMDPDHYERDDEDPT